MVTILKYIKSHGMDNVNVHNLFPRVEDYKTREHWLRWKLKLKRDLRGKFIIQWVLTWSTLTSWAEKPMLHSFRTPWLYVDTFLPIQTRYCLFWTHWYLISYVCSLVLWLTCHMNHFSLLLCKPRYYFSLNHHLTIRSAFPQSWAVVNSTTLKGYDAATYTQLK